MPIPPPLKYRSKTLNEMMLRVNPQNIDGVIAEIEKMKSAPMVTPADYIMRLSVETNLAALSARRKQYVDCGVLANADVMAPGSAVPDSESTNPADR